MDDRLIRKFAMKNTKKEEIFHSSGYARAQSGSAIGAAAVDVSLEARKALEEQRKYVRGYNNSKIMQGAYGIQRAKSFVPRTGGGVGGLNPGNSGEVVDAKIMARRASMEKSMSGGDTSAGAGRGANVGIFGSKGTDGGVIGGRGASGGITGSRGTGGGGSITSGRIGATPSTPVKPINLPKR